jgi:transglutaminase-like putative cysteine protease
MSAPTTLHRPHPRPGRTWRRSRATLRRYWRSQTFDLYTGLGWTQSALQSQAVPAGQALESTPPPGQDLFQQFERVKPDGPWIYAANAPYRVNQPVQAWWRASGDLARLTGDANLYTVLSRPPAPSPTALRSASPLAASLPAEVAERYLALPDTVPERVSDLAHAITHGAPTGYDQARALEQYLRNYPYNLDLPPPPADRDVVDYFLFEGQEGYCDYYASAMVVLARAVGLPARLATGYVQGTYDYDGRRWAVTEKDAHSWVEVYFQGIGWVEFEPTAVQPLPPRPGEEALALLQVPPLPARPARGWPQVPWGLVGLACVLGLLLAYVVWLWRPHPAPAAADPIRERQARLLRWGARLGTPLRDGQTAHEYCRSLAEVVQTLGLDSRLRPVQRAGTLAPAEIERLGQAFVRAQYSRERVSAHEAEQIHHLWLSLRRHLCWLALARGLRR